MKRNLKLEVAKESDLKIVHSIQKSAFKIWYDKYYEDSARYEEISPYAESLDFIKDKFNEGKTTYLILKNEKEEALGFTRLEFSENKDICRIVLIGIKEDEEGKGYGSLFLALLEETFPSVNIWTLETLKQEPRLVSFYEKHGYRLTGKEENLVKDMDLVFFEKKVN